MAKKSVLFTCSLCLPILVLIIPVRFTPLRLAAGNELRGNSSYAPFSVRGCARTTMMQPTGGFTASAGATPTREGCSDPIDKCKKPIKYLGSKGDCACFACEYGKATQHNVCTQNVKDKQTLLAESIPRMNTCSYSFRTLVAKTMPLIRFERAPSSPACTQLLTWFCAKSL